ncbi:glycoprotein-N-acetylgalactosamine 3-beta-galactosyltransferase 1-like [Cimex lectularius]|uniref:Uncharacterized protein n=1 Tax=Cimex lectularius TaxID=79782 RepID=A0A8I6SM21_CIMLE|nr:glycoprotein-N-acetylgalactosamine 3-beta-galactosyltransferase 1-like [Cimex lectularius]
MNCFQLCVFLIGFVFGGYLAVLMFATEETLVSPSGASRPTDKERYELWVKSVSLVTEQVDVDRLAFSEEGCPGRLESDIIKDSVKVTCVVFIEKENNAYAISNTWGRKCNDVLYYSNKLVPFLDVNVFTGKDSWSFLCETIRTLVSFDWVVFANDDLFLIPENLRYALINLDPKKPYYFGHNQIFWGVVFNTKQTAYVLSKGAISLLSARFNSSAACLSSGKYKNNEDYLLGKYLRELGVLASDLRDDEGLQRFHYFTPNQLMAPDYNSVIEKYSRKSLFPVIQGDKCCSITSISFKGTEGDKMFFYRYLFYNVQIFNQLGGLGNNMTKATNNTDEVWKEFILEKMGSNFNLSLMTDRRYYELSKLIENAKDYSSLIKMENGKLKKISIDSLGRT